MIKKKRRIGKKVRKRISRMCGIFTMLALLLSFSSDSIRCLTWDRLGTVPVFATQTDLNDVNTRLDELENSSAVISEELGETRSELSALLTSMETLQTEIQEKQEEIDQCQLDLEQAEADAEEAYEAMKLRIQYMYENSTMDNIWMAILESDGMTDFLNRMEYITTMYQSDRQLVTAYQDAVTNIEDTQSRLNSDMESLLTMSDTYREQKSQLETQIADLETQQDEYAEEISRYQALQSQYQSTLNGLAGTVQFIEESSERNGSDLRGRYGTGGDFNPKGTTGVSGEEIVEYALQFVGNPYVWAGDSLTNGCDCSGFVHLIYDHFGISTPRYSQAFLEYGQVVSYKYLQPGDVVIYPGHVAIYIGNGNIVEAQCKAAGITKYRSVDCHKIRGIRRYI